MLSGRTFKLALAGILLLLLLGALFMLLRPGGSGGGRRQHGKLASGSNLALDLRYSYDPLMLRPADYDGTAEFPLQLDGADFGFYGKRIRGAGKILAKEPGPVLYDFVGSQHSEVFEFWYKLEPLAEPAYEDCELQGRLGLHQKLAYKLGPDSPGWPRYFPDSLRGALQEDGSRSGGGDTAYIEGWALFGTEDLYFFYAVAPRELTGDERAALVAMINGMQFNALGADSASPPAADDKDKGDEETPGDKAPRSDPDAAQEDERQDSAAATSDSSGSGE